MNKRRYKATNVKQVNWEMIATQTQGERMVFGIDVAKEDFFAVLMKADQTVIETLKWVHPQQTREMTAHLRDLDCARIEVAMEPSGRCAMWSPERVGSIRVPGIAQASP